MVDLGAPDRADALGAYFAAAAQMLSAPLAIGDVILPNRLVLAPMAGITTPAYRRRMRAYGAGLVVTEMVSAYGLSYGDRRTAAYLRFSPEERPLAVQVFADRPDVVAAGVRVVLDTVPRADVIDVNMGCPVRKVVKTGAGAALLAEPERAEAVARAAVDVASASGVPVTVKIRSGVTPQTVTAVDVARRLEAAGVAAIAVHPRAASQLYGGRADHRVTAAVVEAIGVPVIASGDVDGLAAAYRILQETGAEALMVARGAVGRPWLIRDLLAGAEGPPADQVAAVDELLALLLSAADDMGGRRAVRWLRKLLSSYLRPVGVPGPVIGGLMKVDDPETLVARLRGLVA